MEREKELSALHWLKQERQKIVRVNRIFGGDKIPKFCRIWLENVVSFEESCRKREKYIVYLSLLGRETESRIFAFSQFGYSLTVFHRF